MSVPSVRVSIFWVRLLVGVGGWGERRGEPRKYQKTNRPPDAYASGGRFASRCLQGCPLVSPILAALVFFYNRGAVRKGGSPVSKLEAGVCRWVGLLLDDG